MTNFSDRLGGQAGQLAAEGQPGKRQPLPLIPPATARQAAAKLAPQTASRSQMLQRVRQQASAELTEQTQDKRENREAAKVKTAKVAANKNNKSMPAATNNKSAVSEQTGSRREVGAEEVWSSVEDLFWVSRE